MAQTIEEILSNWLDMRKFDLVENYNRMGLRASGNWPKQLEQRVQTSENSINGKILGAKYTIQLEHGRRPTPQGTPLGSPSLFEVIKQWINDKGLPLWTGFKTFDSMAWVITNKIHREGIKVPNKFNDGKLVESVFTEEKFNELEKEMQGYFLLKTYGLWQLLESK